MYGLTVAVYSAAMLAGGWLFALRTPGDTGLGRRVVWCCAAMAGTWALIGQAPTVGWVAALCVLAGLCNGGLNSAWGVLAARRVPHAARGRLYARVGAAVNTANVIGYVAGGFLAGRFAPGPVISVAGLVGVVVVALTSAPLLRRESLKAVAAVAS